MVTGVGALKFSRPLPRLAARAASSRVRRRDGEPSLTGTERDPTCRIVTPCAPFFAARRPRSSSPSWPPAPTSRAPPTRRSRPASTSAARSAPSRRDRLLQGLLRTAPLAANVVVVKTLSSGGGGISVPGTDFQLQVPNGAFAGKSMTFTITAYAGSVVAYDFQPHGVNVSEAAQGRPAARPHELEELQPARRATTRTGRARTSPTRSS